jgi:hypothetical protein
MKFPKIEDIKALWGKPKSIDKNKDIDYEKIVKEEENQQVWESLIKRRSPISFDKSLNKLNENNNNIIDNQSSQNTISGAPVDNTMGNATISDKESDNAKLAKENTLLKEKLRELEAKVKLLSNDKVKSISKNLERIIKSTPNIQQDKRVIQGDTSSIQTKSNANGITMASTDGTKVDAPSIDTSIPMSNTMSTIDHQLSIPMENTVKSILNNKESSADTMSHTMSIPMSKAKSTPNTSLINATMPPNIEDFVDDEDIFIQRHRARTKASTSKPIISSSNQLDLVQYETMASPSNSPTKHSEYIPMSITGSTKDHTMSNRTSTGDKSDDSTMNNTSIQFDNIDYTAMYNKVDKS